MKSGSASWLKKAFLIVALGGVASALTTFTPALKGRSESLPAKRILAQTHEPDQPLTLYDRVLAIRELLADRARFRAPECEVTLAKIYNELWAITPSRSAIDEIQDRMAPLVHLFFEARQTLRERLHEFHLSQELEESCVDQARNLMRALRFGEEYLAEEWIRPTAPETRESQQPPPYLAGQEPYLQVRS